MANKYEAIREKVSKDFKDKLTDKDRKIFYLEKLIKDLEKENHDLKVENAQLRSKTSQTNSCMSLLMSTADLVNRFTEVCKV